MEAALGDAACRIPGALVPVDRLTCWLEADQAVAARIKVMRTGPPAANVDEMIEGPRVVMSSP
jgi:hypothetical protein